MEDDNANGYNLRSALKVVHSPTRNAPQNPASGNSGTLNKTNAKKDSSSNSTKETESSGAIKKNPPVSLEALEELLDSLPHEQFTRLAQKFTAHSEPALSVSSKLATEPFVQGSHLCLPPSTSSSGASIVGHLACPVTSSSLLGTGDSSVPLHISSKLAASTGDYGLPSFAKMTSSHNNENLRYLNPHAPIYNPSIALQQAPTSASFTPRHANFSPGTVPANDKFRTSPFWSSKPEAWFAVLEANFASHHITQDRAKFELLLASLTEQQISPEIENAITSSPPGQQYLAVKASLLKTFAESQEQRFRRLVSGLQLGDRPPSQLLQEMLRHSNGLLDASFVRTLWLDRLPSNVQIALATARSCSLDEIAALADNIWDIIRTSQPQGQIFAATSKPHSSTEELVASLQKQLDFLTKEIKQLRSRSRSRSRSSSGHRQSASKEKIESAQNKADLLNSVCWYHRKFGAKATKCQDGCLFQQKN